LSQDEITRRVTPNSRIPAGSPQMEPLERNSGNSKSRRGRVYFRGTGFISDKDFPKPTPLPNPTPAQENIVEPEYKNPNIGNPIVRAFYAQPNEVYYKPNGQRVRRKSKLHLHADGTIMTEHNMNGRSAIDSSVVVSKTFPNLPTHEYRTTDDYQIARLGPPSRTGVDHSANSRSMGNKPSSTLKPISDKTVVEDETITGQPSRSHTGEKTIQGGGY
tara:strand:- start:74 stop:724 length:651 start_codon:yes stop_codon:yes gene_type:complete